ncbi:hypothetical protein ABVK25_007082 [Lepraria finkii]|uniref:Uncharacterized protein n=1 Tax=Lepraria finkii TaxID=1340010 RepID=A0ABR4B3Q5_9LECA
MNLFGGRPNDQESSRKGDRSSRDAHHDNHSNRRSLEKHSRRDSLDGRSRQAVRMPRVSPQEAISSLFDSLIDFSDHITHLKDEFDRDVSLVKQYANPKDMEGL